MTKLLRFAPLIAVTALALTVTACSGGGSADKGSGSSKDWTLGTTDSITALDPAGSYDIGSWNLEYSIFQQLLVIPPNGKEPVGDAAEKCSYSDAKTLTCTLKKGQKFSDGKPLTSADVKHSFERNLKIADANGASSLFASIGNGDEKAPAMKPGAIETPDESTVVFHLNRPDTTFIKILSTAAASIVSKDTFPADKLLGDAQVIGSGPYKLAQFEKGKQAVLEANPTYVGDRKGAASKIFVQFFKSPQPLKQALENKEVDVAWRTLSPQDLTSLKSKEGVEVVEGQGSEFRYWVFNTKGAVGKQAPIRKAVAQLINREAIAKDAYDGNVNPAYTVVPKGFTGSKDSFKEVYGAPDVAKAKKILEDAKIPLPVKITLGYTPEHYGANAVDETTQLQEQLKASGLFEVKVQNAEWTEYQKQYKEGVYDLFHLGWYPDFLDADNYISPFLVDGGFYKNGYTNPELNKLVTEELGSTDEAKRTATIEKIQDMAAADVPLVPSWNGKNVATRRTEVEGVKDTLDPTYIFRLWKISKK